MKAYKIFLFIISVIAMLALMCSFYPADGVRLGTTTLRFPSMMDILIGEEEEEVESPEDFIARRELEIKEMQKEKYLEFFRTDSARFYLPGGDVRFFDDFFKALDNARTKRVRIVHYGDSQIEEDRVSKAIRARLQEKFGGGGPGLVPLRGPFYTYSLSETVTRSPRSYAVYDPESSKLSGGKYGPVGRAARIDTVITATFTTPKKKGEVPPPSAWFNRVKILTGNVQGTLRIRQGKEGVDLEAGTDMTTTTFVLPDSTSRVSMTFSGFGDVYGVMLDNETGVCLDNVPMRGCSGTIFTGISSQQLKQFYKDENVKLIILQYGGNVVPYTKSAKSISDYKQRITKQIKYVREQAPDAKVLFIGPSDMSTSKGGKMGTYEHLPALVDSLRDAALSSGAAFWDLYQSMGGDGSMVRWVKSKPALAGSDYVHFTPRGAELMGDMFSNSLMVYYEYYKLRKKDE